MVVEGSHSPVLGIALNAEPESAQIEVAILFLSLTVALFFVKNTTGLIKTKRKIKPETRVCMTNLQECWEEILYLRQLLQKEKKERLALENELLRNKLENTNENSWLTLCRSHPIMIN